MSNDMVIDDHVPRRLNDLDAGMVRKPAFGFCSIDGGTSRRAVSINSPACA